MEQFGQDPQRTREGSGAGTSHVTIITTYRLEISPLETTERTGAPFACLLGLRGAIPVKRGKTVLARNLGHHHPHHTPVFPRLPLVVCCHVALDAI